MDTPRLAEEIDLSDEQSLQLIINFLEKHSTKSLCLWHLLKYIQEKKISTDSLWPHQLFVNDKNNLKCVLFICSSITFHKNYDLLTENDKLKEKRVSLFSDGDDDNLFMSMIQNFTEKNNLGKSNYHSFKQMELDKETFLQKKELITPSTPSNINIQPLTQSDASIVNDCWTYKSDVSLNSLKYEIEHFPSYGAYRNGELLSWTLGKHDGSIGTLFTKSEARGLNLAVLHRCEYLKNSAILTQLIRIG